MKTVRLRIDDAIARSRPFHGIGVQADAFIYDEQNREAGVTAEDLALFEARVKALAPAIARIFIPLDWFNPARDGQTFTWDSVKYQRLLHHLRNLAEIGCRINLTIAPWDWQTLLKPGMEEAPLALLDRLINHDGIQTISWLTLFNEPDSLFAHESPLYRQLFGENAVQEKPAWDAYVDLHLRTAELLKERGFSPKVQLIVADTVWGHSMRKERLEMAIAAFAEHDVAYSYHNYSPEEKEARDWINASYPGMGPEARMFHEIVGPERELILWEFNNAGPGFHAFFPGLGPGGQELLGSLDNAVVVTDKVLSALANGTDGVCLWCVCDSYYGCGAQNGPMGFGLWRFKWQGWLPRPYYHYYAALCRAFRPGMQIHQRKEMAQPLNALAASHKTGHTVAILNRGNDATAVHIEFPRAGVISLERITPELLPTPGDMPLENREIVAKNQEDYERIIAPRELVIVRIEYQDVTE